MNRFLAALFGIWILLLSPAQATDNDDRETAFEPIDAQELIDHCWEISYELRLGSTRSTRHGFIETLTCLRKTIVEQTIPMFEPDSWSPAYAEWLLIKMAEPYAEFFDRLYNDHKHCFCGTQYHNIDLWAVSNLYETVLRDVIDERNKYQI
jgi:hypothetical protein